MLAHRKNWLEMFPGNTSIKPYRSRKRDFPLVDAQWAMRSIEIAPCSEKPDVKYVRSDGHAGFAGRIYGPAEADLYRSAPLVLHSMSVAGLP